jgi:pyridoxamine 5'-phosphate oxidase
MNSPLQLFREWRDEKSDDADVRDAVALATSDATGAPHVRMVLLRHVDDSTVGWYTNYNSAKGHDLSHRPVAALVWYDGHRGRQVRLEGPVVKATDEESDAYFAQRPRSHQISTVASPQSTVISSPEWLAARVEDVDRLYRGTAVPRPPQWGGYRMRPHRIEFFRAHSDRLHYREVWRWTGVEWMKDVLAP